MRKFVLAFFLIVCSLLSFAVPRGSYYYNGKAKALVSDSGDVIYVLGSDGSVRHTLTIISENSDGSFTTKDENGITRRDNGWWTENGTVYMNLAYLPNTVTRSN